MKTNLKTFPLTVVRCNSEMEVDWEAKQWLEDFEKELREYINFIDKARTHSPSIEMKIKYQIYKEILGETD